MTFYIYTKDNCSYCEEAKELLRLKNLGFVVRKIGRDITLEQFLEIFPGAKTVPQIMNGKEYLGGLRELKRYFFMETESSEETR